MKDKAPTWLKKVNQKIPIMKPRIEIIKPALLIDKEKGKKFTKVYWDGIKLTIKFVEAEAIIIKIKAKTTRNKLSNFPRISVGFVKILFKFSGSCFKKASMPETINSAKKEKINKFKIKLKFPFLSWPSSLTYLEKSPKLKITTEKYAKTVLVTVIKGPKLFLSRKFSVFNNPKNACVVNLTSLSNTDKKNNKIPR